jgi:hypothetical protein
MLRLLLMIPSCFPCCLLLVRITINDANAESPKHGRQKAISQVEHKTFLMISQYASMSKGNVHEFQ